MGLYLANTVLAALWHKERTGEGQSIELPMFETMAQFVLGDHIGGRAFVPPLGDVGYRRLLSNQRGPYATQDGHLCVVVYTDTHWRTLSELLGLPDLVVHDARFASLQTRTVHAREIGAFLCEQLARKCTAQWLALFDRADIPASRVNTLDDLFEDPHLQAVGFWEDYEHPTEGRLRCARYPGTWSRTQPQTRRLAPNLGEHRAQFLDDGPEPALCPCPTTKDAR